MSVIQRFANETPGQPAVHGYLHRSENAAQGALVLTHGAGLTCGAPLLVAVAEGFAGAGFLVLRCDLPFRQARPHGPPTGIGAQDRAGLRRAAQVLREIAPGRIFLGGHSYGGRQASMLAAEDPSVADALLLLSYPLHPPEKPQQMRTVHLPQLRVPALFVHGSRDLFGSREEMQAALGLISAPAELLVIEGAGHDLSRGGYDEVARTTVAAWIKLIDCSRQAP